MELEVVLDIGTALEDAERGRDDAAVATETAVGAKSVIIRAAHASVLSSSFAAGLAFEEEEDGGESGSRREEDGEVVCVLSFLFFFFFSLLVRRGVMALDSPAVDVATNTAAASARRGEGEDPRESGATALA